MQCPRCGCEESKVLKTIKKLPEYDRFGRLKVEMAKERHRICEDCGLYYLTNEAVAGVFVFDSKKIKKICVKIQDYDNVG